MEELFMSSKKNETQTDGRATYHKDTRKQNEKYAKVIPHSDP